MTQAACCFAAVTNAVRRFAMLLALAAFAPFALGQTAPNVTRVDPPRHVLIVGNSYVYYNNSLHGHLRSLVNAADKANASSYTFRTMTISAGNLHEHAGGLPGMVKSRKWDVVIIQGNSTEALDSDKIRFERFKSTAREFDKIIRDSGAKTAMFMTWAYQDRPEMAQPIAEGYVKVANEVGALVMPAGLAFDHAVKRKPDVILHHPDKQHPNLAGTYLAACVFYAALFGKSPVGNEYTADLSMDLARFLQEVAWDMWGARSGRFAWMEPPASVS